MAAPPETSASLLVRLRDATDAASWETFVTVYGPLIRGYCQYQGLQEADAADVGQDVMVRVVRAIGSFEYRPDVGRFRDWLGAVVRNAVRRFRERDRKTPHGLGADERPDLDVAGPADPAWTMQYQTGLLKAACDRAKPGFEPHTWRAFERVWMDQVNAADVAHELDLPVHAVYVAKSRVLQRVRQELLFLAEDMPHALPPE
jgi:RNA polymerase sigma-70 factor (ECF subfamily)